MNHSFHLSVVPFYSLLLSTAEQRPPQRAPPNLVQAARIHLLLVTFIKLSVDCAAGRPTNDCPNAVSIKWMVWSNNSYLLPNMVLVKSSNAERVPAENDFGYQMWLNLDQCLAVDVCRLVKDDDKRKIVQLTFYFSSVELKEINKCVFGFAGTMKRLHKTTKSKVVPYFTWFQRFEEESDVFGDNLLLIFITYNIIFQ